MAFTSLAFLVAMDVGVIILIMIVFPSDFHSNTLLSLTTMCGFPRNVFFVWKQSHGDSHGTILLSPWSMKDVATVSSSVISWSSLFGITVHFTTSKGFSTLFLLIIIIFISMVNFYYHFPRVLPLYFIPSFFFFFQKRPFVSPGNTLVVNSKKTQRTEIMTFYDGSTWEPQWEPPGHLTCPDFKVFVMFYLFGSCVKGVSNTGSTLADIMVLDM